MSLTIMLEDFNRSTRDPGSENEGGVVKFITDDEATLKVKSSQEKHHVRMHMI